jgi:histidine triad (HIT) family protein
MNQPAQSVRFCAGFLLNPVRLLQRRISMEDCVFCQIIAHQRPAEIHYEDEEMIVIQDAYPSTSIHLLVIPKKHIVSLNQIGAEEEALLVRLILKARDMAFEQGVGESGYRVAINTGAGGGQSVFHLHVHLLSGSPLKEHLLTQGIK